jgi:hypothetical protein
MSNKRHAVLTSTFTSYPQVMSISSQIKKSNKKDIHSPVDNFRHAVLTSTFTLPLDSVVYAGRIQEQKALGHYSKSDCFYSLSSLIKRDKNKRLLTLIIICSLFALLGVSTAYGSNPNVEAYKLYAHMKLGSDKQYRCLVDLWTMESHWNPRADNPKSSAYGIPQLLNMKSTNPYVQIDKGLLYITKRYKLPCKALAYHNKKGHY